MVPLVLRGIVTVRIAYGLVRDSTPSVPASPPQSVYSIVRSALRSEHMELRWPTDRIDYAPITERQPLPLPDGAKLIVWPCVNVEHWVISEPMPRTVVAPPGGAAMRVPDIPNWAWHEYGQRVGFWRLKAIFDDFGEIGRASCRKERKSAG